MSGIYGFAAQKSISNSAAILDSMYKALPPCGTVVKKQWTTEDSYVGLGALHPARLGEPGHFARDPVNAVTCVFDGIIYRDANTPGESLVEPDGAALLLERYLKSGIECLKEISGSFNVAWWDEKARRLVLANDKISHLPLFFTLRAGILFFASSLARVVGNDFFSPEIDPEGLADLLNHQYTLGERTLFRNVHFLPPASVLKYEDGRLQIQSYWCLDQIEVRGKYDKRRLDELVEVFKTAVKRSLRPDLTCSIALSGGLDSRCLLAAAANQRLSFIAHTGGQPDSTDVVLAKEVVAQVGVRHTIGRFDSKKLGERIFPMVLHQGGIMAALDSHPCGILENPPVFDAQVEGLAGGITRGKHRFRKHLRIHDLDTAKKALKKKVTTKLGRRFHPEQLWQSRFHSLILNATKEHLSDVLSGYHIQDPLLIYDYFALSEFVRKSYNKTTLITRAAIGDYFPYLDHQWIEAILAVPVSKRVTGRIQINLIGRLYPSLLKIPYEKTLLPLSASHSRVQLTKRYRRIKQKLGKKFSFIAPPPARVPIFDRWHWGQGVMRPVLSELLYNPQAAFRAYLNGETVESLLNQHFAGQKEWQQLVAALAVFEISHKLWVARDLKPSDLIAAHANTVTSKP